MIVPMEPTTDSSARAARRVLKAIRTAKPFTLGKVFKALHIAEGMLTSALMLAVWSKKVATRKKARKKKAKSDAGK